MYRWQICWFLLMFSNIWKCSIKEWIPALLDLNFFKGRLLVFYHIIWWDVTVYFIKIHQQMFFQCLINFKQIMILIFLKAEPFLYLNFFYPKLQKILEWSWFEYGFNVKIKVFDDMKYFCWVCEVWKNSEMTFQPP